MTMEVGLQNGVALDLRNYKLMAHRLVAQGMPRHVPIVMVLIVNRLAGCSKRQRCSSGKNDELFHDFIILWLTSFLISDNGYFEPNYGKSENNQNDNSMIIIYR